MIVEIATLITDDDLEVVAEGPDLVVHQPAEALAAMDPFVVDMHTKSGLLAAHRGVHRRSPSRRRARRTLAFIKEHVPEPRTVPLCGNSIGTDRRFLARYLPEIEDHLHYRSVDVSTIKELARRWYPDVRPTAPRRPRAATARSTTSGASVAELRHYREHVFLPAAKKIDGSQKID